MDISKNRTLDVSRLPQAIIALPASGRFLMRRTFAIVMFWALLAFLAATAVFGEVPASPPSFRFSSNSESLQIPVEVVADGLVLVQAKVNGHPGWFIVDNAVQGFVVDDAFAKNISPQMSGSALTRGEGPKATEAKVIRDVTIGLPGLELTHRILIAIDLKSLEPAIGHEVDGIIGSRLFDHFVVLVDYERHWLSVYDPVGHRAPEKEKAIPVRIDGHGFQFIDATIALPGMAPITGNFLIDSGANSYADIYKPFGDAHQLPPANMKLLDAPGTGAGATTKSKDGRAERIEIGEYSLRNPPITFGEDVEGLMAANVQAGLIGAGFLQHFTVVYNSGAQRIWLTPNRRYADPPEYDQSGLRIRAEGAGFHHFVVNRIVPQSPAVDAGIEPGDVIVSIDSQGAQELTLTEVRRLLRQPKARPTVDIMRGEKRLRVVIQLRPLL